MTDVERSYDMRNSRLFPCAMFLAAAFLCAASLTVSAADVPRLSADDLKSRLGDADLVILDVRSRLDWEQSDTRIVGSERVNPGDVNQWAGHYPKEKVLVLYCA